jgi:hypothetical protein
MQGLEAECAFLRRTSVYQVTGKLTDFGKYTYRRTGVNVNKASTGICTAPIFEMK